MSDDKCVVFIDIQPLPDELIKSQAEIIKLIREVFHLDEVKTHGLL